MFESAIKELKALEEKYKTKTVAFEILGPPRLSKLLYEAYLLQLAYGKMSTGVKANPKDMSQKLESLVRSNAEVRSQIVSIGIPILLSDGKTLLRGKEIKIPPYRGENELKITDKSLDAWAHDGWVDLRTKNMERWRKRFETMMNDVGKVAKGDTSSRHFRTKAYWNNFEEFDPGKIVAWIFGEEEKGKRMKA